MNRLTVCAAALLAVSFPALAAPIYSCTDRNGNTVYTQDPKSGNCNKTSLGSPSTYSSEPAPVATTSSSAAAPQADTNTAPVADKASTSPEELAAAQQKLQEAQRALDEGKQVRYGNERNYTKYLDRINGLEKDVKAAQDALRQLNPATSTPSVTPTPVPTPNAAPTGPVAQ